MVTLETIDSTIEETFEAMFWPEEEMPAPDKGELVMDDEPEREPIIAGQIDVGRVVFETLASAIDPFPKSPEPFSTGPRPGRLTMRTARLQILLRCWRTSSPRADGSHRLPLQTPA